MIDHGTRCNGYPCTCGATVTVDIQPKELRVYKIGYPCCTVDRPCEIHRHHHHYKDGKQGLWPHIECCTETECTRERVSTSIERITGEPLTR